MYDSFEKKKIDTDLTFSNSYFFSKAVSSTAVSADAARASPSSISAPPTSSGAASYSASAAAAAASAASSLPPHLPPPPPPPHQSSFTGYCPTGSGGAAAGVGMSGGGGGSGGVGGGSTAVAAAADLTGYHGWYSSDPRSFAASDYCKCRIPPNVLRSLNAFFEHGDSYTKTKERHSALSMRSRKPPQSSLTHSLALSPPSSSLSSSRRPLVQTHRFSPHLSSALRRRRGERAGWRTMNGGHCRNPTQTMTLQLNRRKGVEPRRPVRRTDSKPLEGPPLSSLPPSQATFLA